MDNMDKLKGVELYRRQNQKIPVKLIPSVGRIIELEVDVTEKNECVTKMYIDMLAKYAEGLEKLGAHWTVTGQKIQIVCPNSEMAEIVRQTWRK